MSGLLEAICTKCTSDLLQIPSILINRNVKVGILAQDICTNWLAHVGLFGLHKTVRRTSRKSFFFFFASAKPKACVHKFTPYDSLVQTGLYQPVWACKSTFSGVYMRPVAGPSIGLCSVSTWGVKLPSEFTFKGWCLWSQCKTIHSPTYAEQSYVDNYNKLFCFRFEKSISSVLYKTSLFGWHGHNDIRGVGVIGGGRELGRGISWEGVEILRE